MSRKIANDNKRFNFSVGELIEILKNFPIDMPVIVSGYEDGYENFYYPEIIRVRHEPDNMYYSGEFQIADEKKKLTDEKICRERQYCRERFETVPYIKVLALTRVTRDD